MAITAPGPPTGVQPGAPDAAATESGTTDSGAPDLPMISGHNVALDGLRVIAALAVLITHVGGETGFSFTGSPASWVVARCDVGVPIFFALSGLLLYRPWAQAAIADRSGPDTWSYLRRRAVRILPAYWVVVVVALVTLNPGHVRSLLTWTQYLLLGQNYDPRPWWDGTGAPGLAQMWSLAVEVSFYLVLPLLAFALTWLARRGAPTPDGRARRLLAGIAMLGLSSYGFCVVLFYPRLHLRLYDTLPHLMTWFAAGMALAVVAAWAHAEPGGDGPVGRLCRTIASSAGACWLIAALAFAIACTPVAGPETLATPTLWTAEIKNALYTVIALALIAPVAFQPARSTWVATALGNPAMRFLGRISYGIFLWQFLVIYAFFAVTGAHDVFHGGYYIWPQVLGILAVVVVGTVAVSTVSYYVLERPAQRLGRRRTRVTGSVGTGQAG
jgi:peptidoglycan/LPS O-acetylase OafA/YrhL